MKNILSAILAFGLVAVLAVAPAAAHGGEKHGSMKHGAMKHGGAAFHSLHKNYEQIRASLADDSLDGVAKAARSIANRAGRLATAFDAADAGVSAGDAAATKALLPKIKDAAKTLSTASDLEAARAAFGDLSASMVTYRDMIQGKKPVVAFCPMVEKKWLQTGEDIGNPFGGKKMARCGEIVSK